ncbi:MAG TPA: cyclophilin-like fold protein [Deltaproteobacteria bacterium]|nr:cyclophilin-like fold protein [Deltaproteobacteria bacterium]HOM30203.1 cyclophilin-like fold protein [Deltaproteobacteria bacterium]HPP81389.1 cyclophilin-like fold protein [Deltaproteobacteria bacterium]
MEKVVIRCGGIRVEAGLTEGPTARKVASLLPIEGRARRWGDEIYFTVPIDAGLEPGATSDVEAGDIAYWPDGPALCIFFGPTPSSTGEKPRAYSPVTVIGRAQGDPTVFRTVRDGDTITIERGE